jgi:nitrite reductase (NADH) small subunit
MTTKKWIRITQAENIPLREGRPVQIGEEEIALFNLGERFLAVENRCPHRGGPLSDGIVSGSVVVCPLHAWKVCLESGEVKKPAEERACVTSYRTRVEDGIVQIEVPGDRFVADESRTSADIMSQGSVSATEEVFAD